MNPRGGPVAVVVLLAVAAVMIALLIEREGAPAPPPANSSLEDDLGGLGPVIRLESPSTGAAVASERAGAAVGEVAPAAHELSVRVDRGRATVETLAVELLFGSQLAAQPKAMRLGLDANGCATLPLGAGAALPFRAEFAFPTLGRSGRVINAGSDREVALVLPPCGMLEFEIVEVDGSAAVESAVVEVRHANAPWPANRWLPVPVEHGRGACPAEVGDYALEVRVRGASQREATAGMSAPDEVGARVCQRLMLPARPALVLQPRLRAPGGLGGFGGPVRVELHFVAADVRLVAHTLPERPGCFAVHPSPALRRTGSGEVLVTARSLDDPDRSWSGELRLDLARSIDLPEPLIVDLAPVAAGR